ncbi:hypothetical protein ACJIZ3_025652 [Penstemon smallii]|uniref:Uncharacterized protein n=1 Tax=Penstemon smallii TaxID=265156 RepID=A0ABD3TWI8_9LAMI
MQYHKEVKCSFLHRKVNCLFTHITRR